MFSPVFSPSETTFAPAERRLLRDFVEARGIPAAWPQFAAGFTRYARGGAVSIGELAALSLKLMNLSDDEVVLLLVSSQSEAA